MRFFVALIFVALNAGCQQAPGLVEQQFTFAVLEDDVHMIAPSLDAVEAVLTQPSTRFSGSPTPQNSQRSARFFDIDRDTLSGAGGEVYSLRDSYKLQVGSEWNRQLTGAASLITRVSISHGRSRYHLPEGAGVFHDPIDIRFSTFGAEMETGLSFETGKKLRSSFEFGGGATTTRTRTEVRSALIAVTTDSTDTSPYVYTAIQLSLRTAKPNAPGLRLRTIAKYYPDNGGALQTGLALAF